MALSSKAEPHKLEIPHEPGEWMRIRRLSAGDIGMFTIAGKELELSIDLVAAILVDWSYGEMPPADTEENKAKRVALVKDLDLDTYMWLYKVLPEILPTISNLRMEDEKKDSASASSPPSGLVEAPGPENSLIST